MTDYDYWCDQSCPASEIIPEYTKIKQQFVNEIMKSKKKIIPYMGCNKKGWMDDNGSVWGPPNMYDYDCDEFTVLFRPGLILENPILVGGLFSHKDDRSYYDEDVIDNIIEFDDYYFIIYTIENRDLTYYFNEVKDLRPPINMIHFGRHTIDPLFRLHLYNYIPNPDLGGNRCNGSCYTYEEILGVLDEIECLPSDVPIYNRWILSIKTIQRTFLNAYYNPEYAICKKRIEREFNELVPLVS